MHHTQEELAFRPFERGDFEAVADIVGRTWLPDSPRRAQLAGGRVDLALYLADSTWSLVAERDGTILGAAVVALPGGAVDKSWSALAARLMAEAEKDPEISDAVCSETGSIEGEAALERDYLATAPLGAPAALRLLIVDPEAKGLGIGGALFSAALEHMRASGATGYHLLTDDACDVGFYDHMGLVCVAERVIADTLSPEGRLRVYVFEQQL